MTPRLMQVKVDMDRNSNKANYNIKCIQSASYHYTLIISRQKSLGVLKQVGICTVLMQF